MKTIWLKYKIYKILQKFQQNFYQYEQLKEGIKNQNLAEMQLVQVVIESVKSVKAE